MTISKIYNELIKWYRDNNYEGASEVISMLDKGVRKSIETRDYLRHLKKEIGKIRPTDDAHRKLLRETTEWFEKEMVYITKTIEDRQRSIDYEFHWGGG